MTASDDDSIHLYNTSAGERVTHPLFSKKYGVSHIRFTHHRNSVIYASTKVRRTRRDIESGKLAVAKGVINTLLPCAAGAQPVHQAQPCRQRMCCLLCLGASLRQTNYLANGKKGLQL